MEKDKNKIREEIRLKSELTDTAKFLLPALGIKFNELRKLGFINCYLSDKDREVINTTDNLLYLLFKPDEIQAAKLEERISLFEEQDKEHLVFLEEYDYSNNYVVLVLKLPSKYKKDYQRFLKGYYSLFSEDLKSFYPENQVSNFINDKDEIETASGKSLQWMVVNRSKLFKEFQEKKYDIDLSDADEYYHLPVMEDEILDIGKVIKNEAG